METQSQRVLILTKSRLDYDGNIIGLNNSAAFLNVALNSYGYESKAVRVVDGNGIDREVAAFKPSLVVLEALWVTADKLTELTTKYPSVGFVVRVHSNVPFLSMEGTAIKQVRELSAIEGVVVAVNNKTTAKELRAVLNLDVPYLPNIYLRPDYTPTPITGPKRNDAVLDVSCFGAIRPMKNQLIQALASVYLADQMGKRLHLHINATRVEQKAQSVLQNIEGLFENSAHTLVQHNWESHPTFLGTLAGIDVGTQVSFSESFNIVTADHVHVGVPIIVSPDISWMGTESMASPTNMFDIANKMYTTLQNKDRDVAANRFNLDLYNNTSRSLWSSFLSNY